MNVRVAILLALAGAALLATAWLGARGRLRRNKLLGIRVPSTLRSDAAWAAGHRAAAVPFALGGLVSVAGAVAVALADTEDEITRTALAVVVLSTVALGVAGVRAHRAARRVPD